MLSLFFAELLAKGAVVTLATFIIFRLASRASPASRHALVAAGMCVLVTLPLTVVTVPTWTVPWLPELTAQLGALTSGPTSALSDERPPRTAQRRAETGPPLAPAGGMSALPVAASGMRPAESGGAGLLLRRVLIIAAFAWLLGALVLLGRMVRGVYRAHTISRVGSTLAEGRERALTAECAAAAGLTREPAVRVTHWTTVPLTWGLFRPLLLLPPSVEFWTDERAEAAIRHEVAHIKRRDYLWHLIGEVATALHWPNPLVWWGRRALRLEQEQACDDSVLRTGADSSDYASHLVEIARATGPSARQAGQSKGQGAFATSGLAPSGLAATDLGSGSAASDLSVRVEGILDGTANRAPLSPVRMVAGVVLAAGVGLAVGGAAVRPAPSTPATAADVWVLATHTSPDAETLLFEELRSAPADRRGVAALSLGRRGDRRAIPALAAALDDPDPYVREYAIVALVEFGGSIATEAILDVARDSVTSVRSVTSWALGELGGQRSAEALLNMIDGDPDMHTRSMAVMALARIDDVDVTAMLTERLEYAEEEARLDIVAALGHSGDPATVPVLDQLARTHDDVSVRIMASRALNEIDDPRRIDTWLAGMDDPVWRVRNLSLLQLSRTQDPRAREAIVEALRDPQHQVRLNAAWALGEFRP